MESLFVFMQSGESCEKFIPLTAELSCVRTFFFQTTEAFLMASAQISPDAVLVHQADLNQFSKIYEDLGNGEDKLPVVLVVSSESNSQIQIPQAIILSENCTKDELKQVLATVCRKAIICEKADLLDSIVQKLPIAIFWKDLDFKFMGCNQLFCDYAGLSSPEDIVGLTDSDLYPEETATRNHLSDQKVLTTGEAILNYDEKVVHFNDSFDIVRKSKIPVRDDSGEIIAVLGIYERITEQVQVQEHLKKEEHDLQVLLDNIPDTIYYKDRDSRFTRINKAQAQTIGIADCKEAIGKTDFDFFDPVHAQQAFRDEQELMTSCVPVINKLERIETVMGFRYVTSSKIPMMDESGECVGLVGVSRDVTSEQLFKEELKREKELLFALMNNIPDRIIFKDSKLRYVRVNKAHCIANGIEDYKQVIGKTYADISTHENAQDSFKHEQAIFLTGEPLINHIEKKSGSNGESVWLSSTKVPIKNDRNEVVGLVGISRDVTLQEIAKIELQKAKEKAEEANKAKSMFLANMSHEIRTPMNGVIGMADILKRTKLDEVQREYLDIIMKSGQTLLAIINDILDFSKIESGRLDLESAPVNIRTIAEDVADIQAIQAGDKGIDFLTYVDPEIPEFVLGDYVRLKQVLTNLVSNAVKFTAKGEVCLSAELISSTDKEAEIRFEVRDTGIGIPISQQQKLFQSFTQVDSSTTRKYGGTGLGLAISQRLVSIMGSEITLESEGGKGSKFSFQLKMTETEGTSRNFSIRNISFENLNVLVVDDNKTNRLIFREYLESWSVKVYEACDGADALAQLAQFAQNGIMLDLAVLDYQMAGMDGMELALRIKQVPQYADLKLILASSVTDAIGRAELCKSDFDFYLNKPVKLEKLYQSVATVLGSSGRYELEIDKLGEFKSDFKKKRIMIVEDNRINMKVAEHSLKDFCPNLTLAYNGKEAIDLFEKEQFDYILMDIQMPVMNGVEATKLIREMEQQRSTEKAVRIIAMTANTMKEDVEHCMQIGMDAFLGKPFKLDDLLKVIDPS
ncbi:PAS domain-containing protein [Mangrovibacterium sp.]|uniref:PAS domain-containing protein n=1 Tax=Mangrovibacterium sp. TaxID=1961364 RepID=UPI00356821BF